MSPQKDSSELPSRIEKLKTNFYLNKEGEVIQKITVHLPSSQVDKLKLEALKRHITLSELIRERLK